MARILKIVLLILAFAIATPNTSLAGIKDLQQKIKSSKISATAKEKETPAITSIKKIPLTAKKTKVIKHTINPLKKKIKA